MNDSKNSTKASQLNPRTAGEALKCVQNILRDLTGHSGLGIIPDARTGQSQTQTSASKPKLEKDQPQSVDKLNPVTAHGQARDHDMHKLSAVSLARTQRSLLKALETLKSSIIARDSWSDNISDRLIRVKADMSMKAQATKTGKRALAACKHIALTEDPFASRAVRAVHRVQALAEQCGATTFLDYVDSSKCELTVSGGKFIVIFSFPDLSPQPTLQVDVNFEYLNADDSNRSEPDIASSFAGLLRTDKFDLIDRAFQTLMQVEELDEIIPNVSLCDALHAFEDTLLDAHALERDASAAMNIPMLHKYGHGLIRRTALGIRIKYLSNHSVLLGIEPSNITRQISTSRLRILSRPSQHQQQQQQQSAQQTPINSSPATHLPSIEFVDGESIATHVQYVLTLNPPVFVSLSVARLLERVAGGEDAVKAALRAGSMRTAPVRDISGSRETARITDPGDKRGLWPNLQMLLAPSVFGYQHLQHGGSSSGTAANVGSGGRVADALNLLTKSESETGSGSIGGVSVGTKTNTNVARGVQQQLNNTTGTAAGSATMSPASKKQLVHERTHWSQTSTEVCCATALPNSQYIEFSHSGGDVVAAVALKRVPIRHPRDVHAVLAVLRQQIVFNKLFQSCFASPVQKTHRQHVLRQPVEVSFGDTPSFLCLSMFDPILDDIVSMVVNIGLGGDVGVALRSSSGRRHVCSNMKASAILRISHSIPLTIHTILQISAASSST